MSDTARASGEDDRSLPEESAEDLYEHAPCGYLSTRPDGVIVKVNQTFLTWTGHTRQELLSGKRFQELLSVGGRIFYETHLGPLLRMQGFLQEIQLELLGQAEAPVPVLVNASQRKDAAGKVLLHRITLFNISDRKKYERELLLARQKAEQAARAKADFLSMVSHEIRTPMNAIIGIASLLQKTELTAQQQKYVRILQSSSDNLLGLLDHILDFSKIDAGKATLEERPLDLRQLVYGTLFALHAKAEEKQLSVVADVDERVPACLVGDPIKLGQVLTNLVGNALKFTERGAVTVTLHVREAFSESMVIDFAVTDTGIGIAEERLPHIFEEFTQASYDIGVRYGGTGLGLAISRKLVELHGGRLGVRSTPGKGSCFSFTLRLKRGEAAPGEAAAGPSTPHDFRGLKVLVAEDNAINVFMLSQFLHRWGIAFDVVGNGQQALERVQQADYELVLMDVRMPERDGYAATRAIRALPGERFQRLPIIAVTASSRMDLENRVNDAGFTDFLCKPYTPEQLAAKLAQHRGPRRPPPAEPPVSFTHVRHLLENDPRAFEELSQLIIGSSAQYRRDFQKALETGDREAFAFQAHKLKPTLELLQARALRAALEQGHASLAQPSGTPAARSAAIDAIHRELDAIRAALEAELRKR